MKKAFKILGIIALVVIVLFAGLNIFVNSTFPKVSAAPELEVEITPERLERGEYLATAVMGCLECHAQRDWSRLAGPVYPHSIGIGGDKFGHEAGFPGIFILET